MTVLLRYFIVSWLARSACVAFPYRSGAVEKISQFTKESLVEYLAEPLFGVGVEVSRACVGKGGWGGADKGCITVQRHCKTKEIVRCAVARYDRAGLSPVTIHLVKYVGLPLLRVNSNSGIGRANESSVPHKGYRRAEPVVRSTVARGARR